MISENIKKARKARGMSQEELAVELNVVRQTVSKWERGLSVPDAEVLIRLAELLEVPVGQLLGTGPEPAPMEKLAEELARLNEELALSRRRERRREQAGKVRGLILFLSFAAMVISIAVDQGVLSIVLTCGCVVAALVILYRNLALLTSQVPEGRKLGALRATTLFDIGIVLLVAVILVLDRGSLIRLSEEGEALLAVGIMSALMLFGGFISPRLPFNRHTGLRLPWTVQDEETWNLAHRILGYISLPMVLLYLAAVWTLPSPEVVSVAALLSWIGIPGLISYVFYWKKLHGRL